MLQGIGAEDLRQFVLVERGLKNDDVLKRINIKFIIAVTLFIGVSGADDPAASCASSRSVELVEPIA